MRTNNILSTNNAPLLMPGRFDEILKNPATIPSDPYFAELNAEDKEKKLDWAYPVRIIRSENCGNAVEIEFWDYVNRNILKL